MLDSWATRSSIFMIGRDAQPTPLSNSRAFWHPELVVLRFVHWLFDPQWTHFNDLVSVWWIHRAFTVVWTWVSGFSKLLGICILPTIFAKPGLMAEILLNQALPSFGRIWLFSLSVISFSPSCWSHSWATKDLVRPVILRLLMNTLEASWITFSMDAMSLLNASLKGWL